MFVKMLNVTVFRIKICCSGWLIFDHIYMIIRKRFATWIDRFLLWRGGERLLDIRIYLPEKVVFTEAARPR